MLKAAADGDCGSRIGERESGLTSGVMPHHEMRHVID